jgi:hypothetical protein
VSFTLAQHLHSPPAPIEERTEEPRLECPTGKRAYPTKREARRALKAINTRQRTNMTPFRCGFCERYHFGHARGAIY